METLGHRENIQQEIIKFILFKTLNSAIDMNIKHET
jgi:hypothetical protein